MSQMAYTHLNTYTHLNFDPLHPFSTITAYMLPFNLPERAHRHTSHTAWFWLTSSKVLLMFTDDQDLLIGGWDRMDQTKRVIAERGATLSRWSIHTPICAPSRSELMSGRYFHNIKNAAKSPPDKLCGSGAVGHIDLENKVYPFTYGRFVQKQP